jgi:hypothetical protein
MTPLPKQRGRPSKSVEMIDGVPFITEAILEREIENLERHRKQCRERYRNKRDLLKTLRPDLFDKRNGNSRTNQNVIRQYGIPIRSNLLQQTQETGNPSQNEGHSGIREISILEASNGPPTQISR